MTVTLGPAPEDLTVNLVRGGSWYATIRNTVPETGYPADFPDGYVIELELDDTSWLATIVGPDATWSKTEEQVETVIAQKPSRARLWLLADGQRIPWAIGQVNVK